MKGKQSPLKLYIALFFVLVCSMFVASVQTFAATGGYIDQYDTEGQFRYTITYDVVQDSYVYWGDNIVCNYARKRASFDPSKDPAEDYYDYSIPAEWDFYNDARPDLQSIFYTLRDGKGNDKQIVFTSNHPVMSIDYLIFGKKNKQAEYYITKVELEILDPISDKASFTGKKTLWAGKWGMKTGELKGIAASGVIFGSTLTFSPDGPKFGDWNQVLYYDDIGKDIEEEYGENKTQSTNISECALELYSPLTTSGIAGLTMPLEIEAPKENAETVTELSEGVLYDQLGAKWPCQMFDISVNPEDKHLGLDYKDGKWYLHLYPDSNAAKDYQIEITQHVLNGKDFTQTVKATVRTFDYKFTFVDASGKLIASQTVGYGETVTPPDPSLTWSCNAYADWQNTKDGPQERIVYTWDAEGKGTKDSPFLISSAEGWENLRAKTQTAGTKGEYYKLMSPISVKTTIGTKEKPFEGIFEGNGKTLTINLSNADNNERTAPFAYTKDATIRNLTIEGNIDGSADHAAGVIGENEGWTLIRNCTVSASIKGGQYIAGFSVGAGGTLKIEDCVFDGLLIGGKECGGFVASGTDTLVLRNCVFAPLSESTIQSGATFVNKTYDTLDQCFYYTALGTPQGEPKKTSVDPQKQEEEANTQYQKSVIAAKNLKVGNVKASAKSGGKGLIIWKKNKSADGYQIRYSTNRNFKKSVKYVKVSKSKVKKLLTKTKTGKTWFVQIRTYKKIKNPKDGKTSVIYGKWSAVNKFKAK